jgi:undecaprenyl-diphosphatase
MTWKKIIDWDKRISQKLRLSPENRGWWHLASFFAHSGDSWWWLTALLLVWLADKFWKLFGGKTITFVAILAAAILTLAVIILAIKFIVRRRRPKGEWGKIYRLGDPHSFPSGHAARSFLIAFIALVYGPLWLGIAILVWAFLVSIARVMMGVHYLSDVIVGTLVGLVWGWIFSCLIKFVIPVFPFIFS